MAVKNFEHIDVNNDVTTTRTLLHEAIPITGSIINSGTYANSNIKNFTHGMFQSVYDYPYLSSSANHIFDLTACYAASSSYSSSANVQNDKKINMYTEFAQTLLGYTGSLTDPAKQVRLFENDLTLDLAGGNVMNEIFVINFSRLLTKDQVKKGTFSITFGTGSFENPFALTSVVLTDASSSADGSGTANVLGGDYGLLYTSATGSDGNVVHGNIFYQAGIAIISASVFSGIDDFSDGPGFFGINGVSGSLTGSSISGSCDALRQRIGTLSFNNTTEINSKIYFCRVPHNKFNYSSNPTYLSGSKIRVKNTASDQPVSYITTIGLYNSSGEMLAVAKLSEPIRKDPTNDITLRVRLDY
jgi:hypothetical protein